MGLVIQWEGSNHCRGLIENNNETIKEIVDYPGFYIGNQGKVYSAWRKGVRPIVADYENLWEKKQFLVDRKRKAPYLYVSLTYRGKRSVYSVHRLVGLHFVKNPKPGIYNVIHHRAYPSNAARDLEWTTQRENCHKGARTRMHKLKDPSGDIVEVRNLKRFCKEKGLHTSNLYNHGHDQRWEYLGVIH